MPSWKILVCIRHIYAFLSFRQTIPCYNTIWIMKAWNCACGKEYFLGYATNFQIYYLKYIVLTCLTRTSHSKKYSLFVWFWNSPLLALLTEFTSETENYIAVYKMKLYNLYNLLFLKTSLSLATLISSILLPNQEIHLLLGNHMCLSPKNSISSKRK